MNIQKTRILTVVVIIVVLAVGPVVAGIELSQLANTWVKRSPLADTPSSPRLGYEGACTWDNWHRVLIRYGGHNQGGGGAQYSEVWTFDPFTAKWTLKEPDTSPPGVCCAQQNIFDPLRKRYVRFPSFSGSHGWQWFRELYLNDSTIWVYNLDENLWRNLSPVPAPHVLPLRCASWDSDAQVIVLFGGEGSKEGTIVYDPHTNTWTRMKPQIEPEFRSGGNMVYDSARKLHILFGSQFSDDPHTWGYSLSENKWRDLKPAAAPPTNQNDAVLAYDSLNRVVVAIIKITTGQEENARHRLETWTYDAGKNTWTKMNPPQEPDASGNRSRVLVFAPEIGLTILENRTRPGPGPEEQQIWTYCFDNVTRPTFIPPPSDLHVRTTSEGAILTWKPSPYSHAGVLGYVVYRGTGQLPWAVDYQKLASVNGETTEYHDSALQRETVYYYAVRAVVGIHLSELSTKVRTQPPIVEDAVVSVLSQSRVQLSWTPPTAGDIAGYYVERADVEVWTEDQLRRLKSRIEPLAEPAVGAIRRIGPFERVSTDLLKGTSFDDKVDLAKLRPVRGSALLERDLSDEDVDRGGKPYRFAVVAYRIRAVNALGVESGPSPYFLTIPSAPRWVFAQEDGTTCRLKWTANPEKNLRGYHIYRLDWRWDKDPISRLTEEPIDELTFSDPTAGADSRRYHVVAVDALGQEGLPSAPVWYDREWKKFYEPFTGQWHQ